MLHVVFFFQAEDGIRDLTVTGVQTCALPISVSSSGSGCDTIDIEACTRAGVAVMNQSGGNADSVAEMAIGLMLSVLRRIRSEEHTSELQSQSNLVCRLLLEKKKKKQ